MMKKNGRGSAASRALALLLALLLALTGCAFRTVRVDLTPAGQSAVSQQTQQTQTAQTTQTARAASGTLTVHFIDVGQADAILVVQGAHAMLVDGGNNADGDLVVAYIEEAGVTSLDYVIATHPHEDHIGGLDDVLNAFEVSAVIMPDKENTTQTFEDFIDAVASSGARAIKAAAGDVYVLGAADFTLLGPSRDYGDDLNDWSVALRLVFGETSFLLAGDAEKDAEADMLAGGLELKSDVLKVGHHGSATSTSEAFLSAVSPKWAVISVGADNDYGHPSSAALNRLAASGVVVYRTDEDGTIVATSDGEAILWRTQK